MNEDDISEEELEAIYEDGANAPILSEDELIALVEGAQEMEKGDYIGHPFRGNQHTPGKIGSVSIRSRLVPKKTGAKAKEEPEKKPRRGFSRKDMEIQRAITEAKERGVGWMGGGRVGEG